MEVRWSPQAFEDLERIFRRIQKENPNAAHDVAKTLYDGCTALKKFPNLGRSGRMKGRRELVFPPLPYIVVYQVKADAVEISRIYHAAQDWP
ncbi:MAG: type II toxin-antitoxin system RelE/ParE family toxin [Candidatus Korobacteraceae bacterium]